MLKHWLTSRSCCPRLPLQAIEFMVVDALVEVSTGPAAQSSCSPLLPRAGHLTTNDGSVHTRCNLQADRALKITSKIYEACSTTP